MTLLWVRCRWRGRDDTANVEADVTAVSQAEAQTHSSSTTGQCLGWVERGMGSADCSALLLLLSAGSPAGWVLLTALCVVASVCRQSCRMGSADCSVHIVVASGHRQSCRMGSAACSVRNVVASVCWQSCGMGSADCSASLLPLSAGSPGDGFS